MIKHLGVMIDCSRNGVMKPQTVKYLINCIAKMGYNTLMLYTEDTYEVENQPLFGYMRGRYSFSEIKDLVNYAEKNGIEMIPCIQTLAHMNQIFRWPEYSDVNDISNILLIDEEKTYKLLDDMFSSLRKCYKTKHIHVGMDEAFNVGLGEHLRRFGYEDRFKLLSRHIERVTEIARKYDFKPMMWGDMFFHLACGSYATDNPDVISEEMVGLVPKDLELVYWDYFATEKEHYDTMIKAYSRFNNEIWFAGSGVEYAGITPHIEYSLKFTKPAMESCRENNIENVFMTVWGDDGQETSPFTILPVLMYAAEIYKGNNNIDSIKCKFKELFNIGFDDMLLLDLPSSVKVENNEGNMDKIMLYSDPFLGFYDCKVNDDKSEEKLYKEFAEKLKPMCSHPEFGYLFEVAETLCRLLCVKYTLGVRTREAYKSGDVKEIIERYKQAEKMLDEFYKAIKTRWYREEKPFGFEVIDIRLGGLKQRLIHCREVLEQFDSGLIDIIEELELEVLDVDLKLQYNIWQRIVSPNII